MKQMRKIVWFFMAALMLTACAHTGEKDQEAIYMNITAQEAWQIMNSQQGYLILDVRTQEEFDEGHIPGAIVIPYDEIQQHAPTMLPDKDQLLLVYCRSGRRSKIAAEALVEMGYRNIKEFGGIRDWPYDIEK